MANHVLLNNIEHKNLRVIVDRGANYGDNVMSALTFAPEFRSLQAHYPIVFHKSADGTSYQPLALLGLQDGENLFLDGNGWDADYIPLTIERQPFLIGFAKGEMVIHVDIDSPRISPAGEAVFLPHGGVSEYLERINSVLLAIHEGLESTPAFVAALLEHDLLESFVLDVVLADGSQNRLTGFYAINEERLAELGGDALGKLNKAGHLQAAYMAIASLSNLRKLIDRKSRRNAGQR